MIDGTDKLIVSPRSERYDLVADPHEERNLFQPDDGRSQQLRVELEQLFLDLSQEPLQTAPVEITAQEAAKLHSLGYVSGGAETSQSAAETIDELIQGADAKDMLTTFSRFQNARAMITNGETSAAADLMIPLVEAHPTIDRFRWCLAVIASEHPERNLLSAR